MSESLYVIFMSTVGELPILDRFTYLPIVLKFGWSSGGSGVSCRATLFAFVRLNLVPLRFIFIALPLLTLKNPLSVKVPFVVSVEPLSIIKEVPDPIVRFFI